MALNTWQGVTITFQSGFFGQITSVRHTGITRQKVNTTHAGTTGAATGIMSDLYQPGQLLIEGYYDNTKTFVTPITAASETVTVTKRTSSQSTGGTVAGTAALSSFEYGGSCDDRAEAATFSATIEFLDDLTFTAGS